MLAVPGSQLGSRISSKSTLLFWTWASLVMVDNGWWYQSFLMQACERGNLPCQRQTPKSEQNHGCIIPNIQVFEISGIENPNGWIVETWKQLFISLWPLPLDNGWLSLFFILFNPYPGRSCFTDYLTQHPSVHHASETYYDSIVDELSPYHNGCI
jgi:hypothetical protein